MDNRIDQDGARAQLPGAMPVSTPTQYEIMAVVILSVAGVIGVVLLFALQVENAIALSAIVLGFLAPTIVSLLSLKQGKQNAAAVQAVKVSVDGRLTQLLAKSQEAARAEGFASGLAGDERATIGKISDRKEQQRTAPREGE